MEAWAQVAVEQHGVKKAALMALPDTIVSWSNAADQTNTGKVFARKCERVE